MIACARMYAVAPSASAAWRALFQWAARRARVDVEVVEHAYPAPLEELYAREDLGCVFMCGLPYARRAPRPRLVAAPVPSPARYGGRPVYFTDFVVRGDSSHRTLEDTFGGRFAYTTEGSNSGYNAPRHHLLAYRTGDRPALYARVLGPYVTPRRALEAVGQGEADVAPLDSYWLDLMRRHAPELTAGVRVIASTAAAPIPPLIASPGIDEGACARLREALLEAHHAPDLGAVMDALLLSCFARVEAEDYEVVLERARAAEQAGYARIT